MMNNEVRLNCGINMPVLGLGTYSYPNDRQTTELAIDMALKVHFARAHTYPVPLCILSFSAAFDLFFLALPIFSFQVQCIALQSISDRHWSANDCTK
jgi:hypothetical protein